MESMFKRFGSIRNDVIQSPIFVQTLIFFLGVLVLSKFLLGKQRKGNKHAIACLVDKLPGPRKYGFLGTIAVNIKLAGNPSTAFHSFFAELLRDWGPICRLWIFGTPKIFVTSADLAYEILSKGYINSKSSELTDYTRNIGGNGFVALPAHAFQDRRRIWNPVFKLPKLEKSMLNFYNEVQKLKNDLEQYEVSGDTDIQNAPEFDFLPLSIRCTFRAICCTLFGESCVEKMSETVATNHIHDWHTVSVNTTTRAIRPWLKYDFIYDLTPAGKETKFSAERGIAFATKIIEERKRERQLLRSESKSIAVKGGAGRSNDNDGSIEPRPFIDELLDAWENGKLLEEDVLHDLNTFLTGGYDTSGVTACVTLFFISLYPEHQEKVVEELREVFGSNFGSKDYSITVDDTKRMKYLEQCIKESLRLFPVVPMFPRRSTQDFELDDGRKIPGGVDVYLVTHLANRDPKYYPDPEEYRPERHRTNIPVFTPFAVGLRSCIGQVYAMLEVKAIVAYMLMAYHWETTETRKSLKGIYQTVQIPARVNFKIKKRMC